MATLVISIWDTNLHQHKLLKVEGRCANTDGKMPHQMRGKVARQLCYFKAFEFIARFWPALLVLLDFGGNFCRKL